MTADHTPVPPPDGRSEELLASAFSALFEQSPDALLVYEGTRMIACNDAAVRLFGARDAADLRRRHPSELAPATQPGGTPSAEIVASNNRTLRRTRSRRFEWVARRLDGTTFPAEVTLTLVDLGGSEGTLTVVHDLTEQRRHEDELTAARNRALAAAQARSEFLASMSHEIRTPMNSIIGFAELLETMEQDPAKRDFIQTIARAGRQLLGLINDILDASKLEAGKVALDPQPLDLRESLEDVAALLAPRAGMKGVDLVFEWVPGTPEGVIGDGLRLRQVVTNLLGNAIKFTDQGQVVLRVWAAAMADGAHARYTILVEDTGIGIAPDKLDRIFARYEQAEAGTAARFGGSGLGLSIARQLAELMGGEITVASEPGRGTAFTVSLTMPLAPAAAPALPEPPPGPRGRAILCGLRPGREAVVRRYLEAERFEVHAVAREDLAAVAPGTLLIADWECVSGAGDPLPGGMVRAVVVPRAHVEAAQRLAGTAFDVSLLIPIQRADWRALLAAVDARR